MSLTKEQLSSLQSQFYQRREFPLAMLGERGFVGFFSAVEQTMRGPKIVLAIEVRHWMTAVNGGSCFYIRRSQDAANGRPLIYDFATGKIVLPSEIQAVPEPGVTLIRKAGSPARAVLGHFVENDSTRALKF
jgi:hypothetical protein